MNVLANVTFDMQRPGYAVLYAVQGDRLTRQVNAKLVNAGAPWTVPDGALMMIRYYKPDGTAGFYDTDENGNTAYTISGSSVTFTIAQQALAVVGNVAMQLNFYSSGGEALSSFPFVVTVQPSVYNDAEFVSTDYYNVLIGTLSNISAEVRAFQQAMEAGYNAPLKASTVASMTNQSKVYVYTGSETGYTAGHWYYWNGSAWTDGGVYNAVAINIDDQLSLTSPNPVKNNVISSDLLPVKSDMYHNTGSDIGVRKNTFSFVTGAAHSSHDDQIIMNVPAGWSFTFDVNTSVSLSAVQIWAYYADNSQTAALVQFAGDSYSNAFTASKDIVAFGIYLDGSLPSCTVSFSVKINGGLIDEVNSLKSDLNVVANATGGEFPRYFPFTNGRFINNSTGADTSNSQSAYSDFIPCDGFVKMIITMIKYDVNATRGLAFYSSANTSAYISGVKSHYDTSLSGDTAETRTIDIPANAKYFRTTWFATTYAPYSEHTFMCKLVKTGSIPEELDDIEKDIEVTSANVLNPIEIIENAFINLSGSQQTNEYYAVTGYIEVNENDVIVATFDYGAITITMRYVTAYNADKTVVPGSGAANVSSYTVPAGVKYVRISATKSRLIDQFARIGLTGTKIKYETYYSGLASQLVKKHHTDIDDYKYYPLTMLPEYFVNTLSYKPLGVLSKGYICLVSDDGAADLATYTIPMFASKEVPGTWAIMKGSSVLSTQAGIDAVVNSVNNNGCQIAQHGGSSWENYDELTLNTFFDEEQEYFESIGLTPYGAVCPAHDINNLIRVIAGGRFGCLRTGYDDGLPRYTNYTNGPRSNIYGLTSQSSLDGSLETQKAVLDYVKDNHLLRIIHWHENELDAAKKAQLEGIIDYAKSIGLTFITMKEIPWII